MPVLAYCACLLRKKGALPALFGIVLLLLLLNIVFQSGYLLREDDTSVLHLRKLNQPFHWHEEEALGEAAGGDLEVENSTGLEGGGGLEGPAATCRNSVQGRSLVADERGFLCGREQLLVTGCCNSSSESTSKYDCSMCSPASSCCSSYEHCISCCLRPQMRHSLQQVLQHAVETNNVLFVSVSDHFELCLAKCRTSSSSVQHENTYRNREHKFCYGNSPPPLSADSSKSPLST